MKKRLPKRTGGHQWGGVGDVGVQMERNSVAKPPALIKTTIFLFLPRDLKGAPRDPKILRAGKTGIGCHRLFSVLEVESKVFCAC